MPTLITGASGFAGGYLAEACAAAGEEVVGVSRSGELPAGAGMGGGGSAAGAGMGGGGGGSTAGVGTGVALDLGDADAVRGLVADVRPDVVYHLAALSSVGRSWEDGGRTVSENVAAAVNLLEAVRAEAPRARVLWASSCEVYGSSASLPIEESAPLSPESPYAVSKVSGDQLAGIYGQVHGLDLITARPFNHAGPRQREIFIASSLAHQAARARLAGASTVRIATGNPNTRRDFTDVRDVVRAYRLLVGSAPAGIYNVSSGRSVSAGELVALVAELLAPVAVEHEVDQARVRAHEVMDLRGSHERLTAATGWEPEISLRQTLSDTIAWWERELREG